MSFEEEFPSITKYYEDDSLGVTGICPPEKDFSIGYVDISFSDFKRVISDCCIDKKRVVNVLFQTIECKELCVEICERLGIEEYTLEEEK